ncbi:hypothetical protein F2Q69_00035873 [Brassica cretica]|uniref:Uncharacterized protein n=1 Tax=Brassica cretica TaxID=69181 RepID=A0A8S9SNN2_BRACR|nr:hypothetical protein F2Q69_00035873 [Brassica cretica]
MGRPNVPIHGTPMKPVSTLHLPSRLSWPLRVDFGLLPSLLVIYVCSQDTEEAKDMFIHDQTLPMGHASLPPSVPMKLSFYTHLPSRLSQPLEVGSALLSSSITILVCSKALEDALSVNNTNQNPSKECRRKPWRACKGTEFPALYRRRGIDLSKGCTLFVSFLAIDLINGPDHTHSPMAVTRRPGTVKPLLDM